MASSEDLEARIRALEEQLSQERAQRADAERQRAEAERQRADVERQLAKTAFADFLYICHTDIFMQLKVQKNSLLATTGGFTRVDGKCYPRYLRPWSEFAALHEESFCVLEEAFQLQQLFPSPAGLGYLSTKLADRMLASEEDLKNFECLAVEGCVLDVIPRFIDLVGSGAAAWPGVDVSAGAPSAVRSITFNNYPFGVIAAESDEEEHEPGARGRSRPGRRPLVIKDDRPAYIGALGVARRDMDAAIERAAAEAEIREKDGPRKKRMSPERTKVHPDQWCFRHNGDGTIRPLFVVEYKAAHKVDGRLLRNCLSPQEAGSLMEDAIKIVTSRSVPTDPARLDIAKVITQVFHYMVDYGLQYSYTTTGEALLFFYLDPDQPSTLYYHLEEPKTTVKSAGREDIKHSAVALVLAFVLVSSRGKYITQAWKKTVYGLLPKWPEPYEDMSIPDEDLSDSAPGGANASLPAKSHTLAPAAVTAAEAEACGDPEKHSRRRRRDQDDESDPGDPTFQPRTSARALATPGRTLPRRTARTSSTKGGSGATARNDPRQASWAVPADAVLSPTLDYCTQACLLGLKAGGRRDPTCPNADLHRANDGVDGDDNRHPLTPDELREKLTQQLAEDMDHDCYSLEPYGMFGAVGALFKIALSEYGYCLVGKGVQRVHRKRLEQEAAAYELLKDCQGRLVPVNLGTIQLVDEYWTACGAHISHMMLMSFGGESLWHHGRQSGGGDHELHHEEALRTLEELKPYRVLHGDLNDNNMVWNEELRRVMIIDFDHAVALQEPPHGDRKRAGMGEDGNGNTRRRLKRIKGM